MLSLDVEKLLRQRYYLPGENWESLVNRVVNFVCEDESEEYRNSVRLQIYNRVWLPNSPTLVNSRLKNNGLMACFVRHPTEDTLEDHFATLADIAAVGKRGGGCGFGVYNTNVRHKNAPVSGSTHGFAYGPNWWASLVSYALDGITQGGFRRMALMYNMSSDHPDLEEFIYLKQGNDEDSLYNFNQSVFASDEWMEKAIEQGKEGDLLWQLSQNAWNNGEPGLLFSDTINNNTPYKTCGCKIYSTNPCSEQPLPNFGSCNLGSINISHDVFFDDGSFSYARLTTVVRDVTRFLDNVGSKNQFPTPDFEKWYEDHRPIGIGIMGYADALLKMGLRYGSKEALTFLRQVMRAIEKSSYKASEMLGKERGIPAHCSGVGRRNITTTTIAPTGSISFIAECSSSIEPIWSPNFKRTDERGQEYYFRHAMSDEPYFVSAINSDPRKVPTWKQHLDTQIAAQDYVDSGVSKTINLLSSATVDDVRNAFIYAWENGAKGLTVYRDGSRDKQVLENLTIEDSLLVDCPTGVCDI